MTNEREIERWKQKLRPYITAVEMSLYVKEKKLEDLMKLQEKCRNVKC